MTNIPSCLDDEGAIAAPLLLDDDLPPSLLDNERSWDVPFIPLLDGVGAEGGGIPFVSV